MSKADGMNGSRMTIEASHYFDKTIFVKLPTITRGNSIKYIQSIYKKKAVSVEVSGTKYLTVCEIIVRFNRVDAREVLYQVMKGNPTYITEVKEGVCRVGWKF